MRLVHSHTSIKLYEQCPYKYYRLRVIKDIKEEQTAYSAHGDRVHKSFEERIKNKTALAPEVQAFEPVVQRVEEYGGVVLAEQQLAVNEELRPTSWFARDVWIRCKIDVLVLKNNVASIIDWKTGKRRKEYLNFDQLELNALMVFANHKPVTAVNAGFVWTGSNGKIDRKSMLRDSANTMWSSVVGRIRKIYTSQENDNWPGKPSKLCDYCVVRPQCPYTTK